MSIEQVLCYGSFTLLLLILAVVIVAVVGTEVWRVVERRRYVRELGQSEVDRLDRWRNRNVLDFGSYRRRQ